jgi:hypothetical protein
MTGAGVPDPENPGQWLVSPWPPDAGFWDVVEHFQRASLMRLPHEDGTPCQWAFHEGLRAALVVAPTTEIEHPAQWYWCGHLLGRVERDVSRYRQRYVAEHGHDPQAGDDQHVEAVKQRRGTQQPEP